MAPFEIKNKDEPILLSTLTPPSCSHYTSVDYYTPETETATTNWAEFVSSQKSENRKLLKVCHNFEITINLNGLTETFLFLSSL